MALFFTGISCLTQCLWFYSHGYVVLYKMQRLLKLLICYLAVEAPLRSLCHITSQRFEPHALDLESTAVLVELRAMWSWQRCCELNRLFLHQSSEEAWIMKRKILPQKSQVHPDSESLWRTFYTLLLLFYLSTKMDPTRNKMMVTTNPPTLLLFFRNKY